MKKQNIKTYFTFLLILAIQRVNASPTTESTETIWAWAIDNYFVVVTGIVVIGVLFTLLNMMNRLFETSINGLLKDMGVEPKPKIQIQREPLLSRLYKKAWALVPIEKEADIDLGHDYDGIKELDNSLPPWWLYGFYLTILIGIGYLYVYHLSDIGLSQIEEYELAMEEGNKQKAAFAARQANSIDEENLIALEDAVALNEGKDIYVKSCVACHGNEGQGGIGPNLTDDYWIHGGSISNIYKVIKNGVPEKGMISWQSQLQPAHMHKVASYIKTLQGTNPPNPKDKQGELYVDVTESTTPLN